MTRPQLNAFVKPSKGRQSLVLAEAETRDEAQESGAWIASTAVIDMGVWQ